MYSRPRMQHMSNEMVARLTQMLYCLSGGDGIMIDGFQLSSVWSVFFASVGVADQYEIFLAQIQASSIPFKPTTIPGNMSKAPRCVRFLAFLVHKVLPQQQGTRVALSMGSSLMQHKLVSSEISDDRNHARHWVTTILRGYMKSDLEIDQGEGQLKPSRDKEIRHAWEKKGRVPKRKCGHSSIDMPCV